MEMIERIIVQRVISDLLKAGFRLGVNDGEETTLKHSKDMVAITAAMYSTDEDYLLVYRGFEEEHFGWVRLIYGNGRDVVSDYTTNLETDLHGANVFADMLEEGV
jgi:hypothetical protein